MRRSSALSVLLSVVLVVALACLPSISLAVTQDDLNDSVKRAEDLRRAAEKQRAQARDLSDQVGELDAVIAGTQAELGVILSQISEVERRRETLESEIAALETDIAEKQDDIARTQAQLEERNDALAARATETYKQGDTFMLELLFEAKSISDLLARTTLVQAVMTADQRAADELRSTRRALEQSRMQLDRDLQTVEAKRQEVLAEEARLESLRWRQQSKLNEQASVLSQKESLLAETAANAERLRKLAEAEEAESQRIAQELEQQASSGSGVYNGEMKWPVAGFYRITSPFGPRICPYHGQENHSGIDVGSNQDPYQSINGAPIVAAGNGTVIRAEYYSGYGNTVMIDHGNGVVTLYAHQQSGGITVSRGQSVVKGQRIGTVGSTGYSTGPHLHFEVRVNGTPTNPMGYLQ